MEKLEDYRDNPVQFVKELQRCDPGLVKTKSWFNAVMILWAQQHGRSYVVLDR